MKDMPAASRMLLDTLTIFVCYTPAPKRDSTLSVLRIDPKLLLNMLPVLS